MIAQCYYCKEIAVVGYHVKWVLGVYEERLCCEECADQALAGSRWYPETCVVGGAYEKPVRWEVGTPVPSHPK